MLESLITFLIRQLQEQGQRVEQIQATVQAIRASPGVPPLSVWVVDRPGASTTAESESEHSIAECLVGSLLAA